MFYLNPISFRPQQGINIINKVLKDMQFLSMNCKFPSPTGDQYYKFDGVWCYYQQF